MCTSTFWPVVRKVISSLVFKNRRRLITIFALLFLLPLLENEQGMAHATSFAPTGSTVSRGCIHLTFTSDGNPFPLCPGPYPTGGNCTWWAWEQWHLLGYNLPSNWGNAAQWIADAQRSGLPIGTTPRVASIAVFPVADGVWAYGIAGHVAFVTSVAPGNGTFNVTYQNYGNTTPMFVGTGYNVSNINEPRFQKGELRFIYFPKPIDPGLFAKLPGVNGNSVGSQNGSHRKVHSIRSKHRRK